jgi:hypothetical protein
MAHAWRVAKDANCRGLEHGAGVSKQILSGVSGSTRAQHASHEPSSMLAILGPSGAGKSTLLDALGGRPGNRKVVGRIAVQGIDVNPAELQQFCGYVLQDDVFPGPSHVYVAIMSLTFAPCTMHSHTCVGFMSGTIDASIFELYGRPLMFMYLWSSFPIAGVAISPSVSSHKSTFSSCMQPLVPM